MSLHDLPDAAEWSEHGWRIDINGVLDPQPAVPTVAIALAPVALLVAWVATWWLLLPFLALAAVAIDPRGGTLFHGLSVGSATLHLFGFGTFPLHELSDPEVTSDGLAFTLQGRPRRLVLAEDPEAWAWIAKMLVAELQGHGEAADVPEKMVALRGIDC